MHLEQDTVKKQGRLIRAITKSGLTSQDEL
jgi:hypothetical protein